MLDRFRKPRWQSRDPETRRKAVMELSPDQPQQCQLLWDLACADPDPSVRGAAVKRLPDLASLRSRMREDSDAQVREAAALRYRQLLVGGGDADPLERRLAELAECQDPALLAHLARSAREEALRLAAMERLNDPGVLEEAALHDSVARVRLAAVERLHDPERLEKVARGARGSDARVARLARDRLDAQLRDRQHQQAVDAEAAAVCEALEALAAEDAWSAESEARRRRLQNRWGRLTGSPENSLAQRHAAAEEAIDAQLRQREEARARAPDPAELAVELLAELDAGEPDVGQLAQCRERLAGLLPETWQAPPPELQVLERRLQALDRYLAHREALAGALEAGEDPSELVRQIDWPADLPAPEPLERAAAQQAAAQEPEAPEPVAPPPRRDEPSAADAGRLESLGRHLDELSAHLDEGRLRPARRALKQCQSLVDALKHPLPGRFERRLQRARARVSELQDWRRFAILPKQQELCEQMEALAARDDLEPPERARLVHELQEAWKATGGSDSPQSRQLWERFRRAGEAAFEPCKAYFAEEAERRRRNLEERTRICEQLERFLAEADWPAMELRALEEIRNTAREEWRSFAPVDRRAGKALAQRFDGLLEQISEQLSARRKENRNAKAALVAEAQSLLGWDDPMAATREAKTLQQRWKAVGSAGARRDRALWKDFRAACDELFARRDQARDAVRSQREAARHEAEEVCAALEALTGQAETAEALAAGVDELRRRFEALESQVQGDRQSLVERWRRAGQEAQQQLAALRRERRQDQLELLYRRAALCEAAERAAAGEDEGLAAALEALRTDWGEDQDVPAPLAEPLEARRQALLDEAAPATPAGGEDRSVRLRELCVRLEILGGLDSPAEDGALRMSLQVERLSSGMGRGEREEPDQEARRLAAEWLGFGPARREADPLAGRFFSALERLL